MQKVAVLDTETTGTEPGKHGVIQIAGAILLGGQVAERFDLKCRPFSGDVIVAERFDLKCRPFSGDVIEPEALEVQNRTLAEIQEWADPVHRYRQLLAILGAYVNRYDKRDKLGFAAFNAHFDNDHMRAWFNKCDPDKGKYFGSWFWTPPMDLMSAAALLFGDARLRMENFKQGTVCQYLGIEAKGDLHDADVDVELAIEVYRRLTTKWFEQWDEPGQ